MTIKIPITPEMRVQLMHAENLEIDLPLDYCLDAVWHQMKKSDADCIDYNEFMQANGWLTDPEQAKKPRRTRENELEKQVETMRGWIQSLIGAINKATTETPAAKWRANGEADPHLGRYLCQRADLPMGKLTDDELANTVFLYDHRSGLESMMYLTAAKERIRWLSRLSERNAALISKSCIKDELIGQLIGEIGEALVAFDSPLDPPATGESVFEDIKRRFDIVMGNEK